MEELRAPIVDATVLASLFARAQERLQALFRDHHLQKARALIFALGKHTPWRSTGTASFCIASGR